MDEQVPTYGLLAINHAYNEGKLTFKEWLELSRAWAQKMIEQHGKGHTENTNESSNAYQAKKAPEV